MTEEKLKIKLTKELKALFLSVLKNNEISDTDINQICKLSGIEPHLIEIEIIDSTDKVDNQN